MQREKGQIEILLLVLAFIGVFLFFNFIKGEKGPESKSSALPYQEENLAPSPSSESEPAPDAVSVLDYAAPYRFNSAPTGGLPSNTRQTVISLETNEKAVCKYGSVSGLSYDAMQYVFSDDNGGKFHSARVTALSEGMAYNYFVKCLDQFGNKNLDDFAVSFWVNSPADFTPPILSYAYPSGDILATDTFETIIGVSTNEPASCRYSWSQGTAYDSMGKILSPADGTKRYHIAKITGLAAGNAYNYFVRCKDFSGNANTGDVMISFTVGR